MEDIYFVTELLGTDLHRLLTSRPLEKQFIQYEELGRDLNSTLATAKSFRTSILAVEKALGLSSEQIPLPEEEVKRATPPDAMPPRIGMPG